MLSTDFARFFAETVRGQRKRKKLTQEQLAERADLSSKMISLIERGERTPSIAVADSIARGVGVPLWRLVKDAEDLKRKERAPRNK
jgi:transcriptional regulator with XRE-family HTH domain